MDYDFELEWSLNGARYVTKEEYDRVVKNPNDQEAIQKLADHNIFYGHSCDVLNKYCMDEMAEYRKAIVERAPEEKQNDLLKKLFSKYSNEIKKHPKPATKPSKQ